MANTGVLTVGNYTIPVTRQEFNNNFGNVVPLTQRVVGMDGGYDLDGDYPSPTQVGRLTFGFWLRSQTRAGMDALRDAVRELPTLGRQLISYQPTETTDPVRYIWGKVNAYNMGEQKGMHTDLWQRVQLIIQCTDPRWYSSVGYDHWDADGSIQANGTYDLTYGARTLNFTSTPLSFSVAYSSSAVEFPEISIVGTGLYSFQDWAIQRIVDGVVMDEVSYDDIIDANNEFTIDASRKIAQWNGRRAWGSKLTYKHPDLLRFYTTADDSVEMLIVGTVITGIIGDLQVNIWYKERWR